MKLFDLIDNPNLICDRIVEDIVKTIQFPKKAQIKVAWIEDIIIIYGKTQDNWNDGDLFRAVYKTLERNGITSEEMETLTVLNKTYKENGKAISVIGMSGTIEK